MPCAQYYSYKNTLCQDKQWPEIWWTFLSRDNEVWLTLIKLNWASATGVFQRQWEGLAENQKPLYLQKGGKQSTLLKRAWRDLRVPTSAENKEKSAATQRVGLSGNWDGLSQVVCIIHPTQAFRDNCWWCWNFSFNYLSTQGGILSFLSS